MKKFKIKETYLILLIVISLASLSIYSTFALFTTSTEIPNVVDITANLDLTGEILEYDIINIPAGESKTIEFTINNDYTTTSYYGVWYELTKGNSSDLNIGIYKEKNNTPGTGTIGTGNSVKVLIGITNNGTTTMKLNLGVKGSKTSSLGLPAEKKIITEEWGNMSPSETTLKRLGLTVNTETPDFSKTSCSSGCDEATVGVYKAEDDLGDSYYFRGDVENNYVLFADIYWRIVRINGDGTVRMIFDGFEYPWENGDASSERVLDVKNYNYSVNDNAFVGYMYGTPGSSTYEATHANINPSNINGYVDSFYNAVLSGYSQYIADAIYCNDRGIPDWTSGTGISNSPTAYMIMDRVISVTSPTPTLMCTQENDRFTVEDTINGIKGNSALTFPIGLITADEVVLAGASATDTQESSTRWYYLFTGQPFWTMTPMVFSSNSITIATVNANGSIKTNDRDFNANTNNGVKPVISLKADAITGGTGTIDDPFIVS